MNAALLLVAVLSVGQVDPPSRPDRGPGVNPAARPPVAAAEEAPLPFTLDTLAAGARNDAFVDEYIKDKGLSLFGQVLSIERFTHEDKSIQYRLVMERLGHEDNAVDVEVFCYFSEKSRKELATLEPGVSKVTVQGSCKKATLIAAPQGVGFTLEMQDCKIIETPAALVGPPPARSGSAIVPNIIEPGTPLPPGLPNGLPGLPPRGPNPPPLPQQP